MTHSLSQREFWGESGRANATGGTTSPQGARARRLSTRKGLGHGDSTTACQGARVSLGGARRRRRGEGGPHGAGNVKVNVVPCPSTLSTVTRPAWATRISRTI